MYIINNDIQLNIDVNNLINYLEFSFKYKNDSKFLFILKNENNKNYNILINITKENSFIYIDEKIICDNYSVKIIMSNDLLIELYSKNSSLIKIMKSYWDKKFQTEKFSFIKFKRFLDNFNFKEKKWEEYYNNL
jgi:hypothetical protein